MIEEEIETEKESETIHKPSIILDTKSIYIIIIIKINMNVWVDIEIYLNNLKDKEIMKVIWHIWILD